MHLPPIAVFFTLISSLQANMSGPAIRFANLDWTVKTSEAVRVGPGPNYFGSRAVSVDSSGLHLQIVKDDDRLLSAEVVSR